METTHEIKNIKDEIAWIKFKTGASARHIGLLCDVTPATVWNWLNGKTEPSASQMDILRGFFQEVQKAS